MGIKDMSPEMLEVIRQNQHLCLLAENLRKSLDVGQTRKTIYREFELQLGILEKLGQGLDISYAMLGHFGLLYWAYDSGENPGEVIVA